MQIYLYVNPRHLKEFVEGETKYLYGYTVSTKSDSDDLMISVPVKKAVPSKQVEGEYELDRELFKDQF